MSDGGMAQAILSALIRQATQGDLRAVMWLLKTDPDDRLAAVERFVFARKYEVTS